MQAVSDVKLTMGRDANPLSGNKDMDTETLADSSLNDDKIYYFI